ncbi:PA2778 family cysteine peptidase [Yoonia sp. SS1-5]|uniref:PA2778 family cysteine peptidase n=1 Tax=Yoonia rhodophyticola TaxID=3137370 RepID=A0AAN0NJC2_9RHOB
MRPLIRRFCAVLTLCWLAACAAPFDPAEELTADIPTRAVVAGVPLIQQADFYCGPASIAMVMQWAGADVTQADIAALSFSPGARGTYLADMIGAARRQGQFAVELSTFDALLAEVSAGHPVIVFQNLGLGVAPVWHYGVVTGYDLQSDQIFLNSGERDQMVMPFDLFARTWRRGNQWGLVILPPDQLPATATEAAALSAAAALERVKVYDAAETAYQTGAGRWPESWLWQFGLGNVRYAMGDMRGAERALLAAGRLAPDIPEIGANLATVRAALAGKGS